MVECEFQMALGHIKGPMVKSQQTWRKGRMSLMNCNLTKGNGMSLRGKKQEGNIRKGVSEMGVPRQLFVCGHKRLVRLPTS